ncbi:MAG: type II toxin-antitoxin system Phd/YefM family antitoxin [Syntrophales bacterium]|jgi:prevent-host-death family protein
MNTSTVSIAEGKKGFSRLIQDTQDKQESIIVTRRGQPVAVIVPYEEYNRTMRMDGYRKIMEVREMYIKTGINASEIYEESRKQLEERK